MRAARHGDGDQRARRPEGFVFRPRTNQAACVIWVVLAAGWIALELLSGWQSALTRLPLIGAISVLVYAVFGRPRVSVGTDAVDLINVVRDVHLPLRAVTSIDTRYALTLGTANGRRYQAWAAPAGGRFGAARVTEEDRRLLGMSGTVDSVAASAGLRSDAGAAGAAIRRRQQEWAQDGATREPDPVHQDGAMVTVRWATGVLIAFGVCVAATVLTALLST